MIDLCLRQNVALGASELSMMCINMKVPSAVTIFLFLFNVLPSHDSGTQDDMLSCQKNK